MGNSDNLVVSKICTVTPYARVLKLWHTNTTALALFKTRTQVLNIELFGISGELQVTLNLYMSNLLNAFYDYFVVTVLSSNTLA